MEQISFFGASQKRVSKTKYVWRVKTVLVRESRTRYAERSVSGPQDVVDLLRDDLGSADREYFVVLLLNIKNRLNGIYTVSIGDLNSTSVHPREVFKPAILGSAAAVILAHNHPSGDPEPSSEDVALTQRLVRAGQLLGIEVLDHLVIGENSYVSLKKRGLL